MFGDNVDVKDLVERIVRAVVRYPEQVAIKALRGEHSVLIEIRVAPEDTGLLIGRRGATIRAIRHVAHVVGARHGQKVQVVVLNSSEDKKRER